MSGQNATKFLLAVALGVTPLTLPANGFRLASQDAFATARGEAFVATADNPSAIYYNPAGITQLEGNNVRAGLYGIYLDPSYQPPGSAANSANTYHIDKEYAAVPQFFYTYTPKDWVASFGLGIYAPYGGNVSWPQDTGFRAVAIDGSLTYLTINPALAVKILPSLSIGGGLMVNYVDMDLEQGLLRNQFPNANYFRFVGNGWSVGYNAGLRWQPLEKISVGVSFHSSAKVTLNGQTRIEQYPVISSEQDRSAHTDFTFPLTMVGGISYRPTPKWNLEFDADYTDWRSFGSSTISQSSKPPGINQNIQFDLNWQRSWMYELGVTRIFDNRWHISAGYVFDQNSVPDANYTPLAADLDRHFFCIGAGHKGNRFDFDLAYQLGYGPARAVAGSKPSTAGQIAGQTADGTYAYISHAVMVTVGMHF